MRPFALLLLLACNSAWAQATTALLEEKNSDTVARLVIATKAQGEKGLDQLSLQAMPRPPELAIPRMSES